MGLPRADQVLHNPAMVWLLAEYLRARGHDPDRLLRDTGLVDVKQADDQSWVPFENIAAFFEGAAKLSGDDMIGFRFGQQADVRNAGLVAYVGLNAPTLHDAVRNVAAYAHVFGDAIDYDLARFDREGRMIWGYRLPPSRSRRQYVESYAAIFLSTFRHYIAAPIRFREVSFIHPRKTGMAEMERYFGCRVTFGGAANTLVFDKGDLDRKIVNADQRLLGLLERIARETLAKSGTNRPELVERAERAMMAHMPTGDLGIDRVARDLGMSARTLSRRLADLGLTYGALLSSLREALATRYLTDSDMSVTEIAFLLGYSDTGSFSAAYRQWTGRAPSDARQG